MPSNSNIFWWNSRIQKLVYLLHHFVSVGAWNDFAGSYFTYNNEALVSERLQNIVILAYAIRPILFYIIIVKKKEILGGLVDTGRHAI